MQKILLPPLTNRFLGRGQICPPPVQIAVVGTASFFLSPQSANPQSNFNFLNPQPQVRNWTFKSLVRNRKSATTFQDS